jgi:hypothetical protein
VPDVDLHTARRDAVVDRLRVALMSTAGSAQVALAGSLGAASGDAYSDIDIVLTVDADEFAQCLAALPDALGSVQPLRLLRVDPETLPLPDRRVVFALFAGLPIFWRLDLDVHAGSGAGGTTALSELPWLLPVSALMNGIAAVKAVARHDLPLATTLLRRAFDRIGVKPPTAVGATEQIIQLARACTLAEPSIADVADEVIVLAITFVEGQG